MKTSKDLEQRVQRIHELLEGSGAEVKWDDHVPDPDNPSQMRQIDVSIRRDGLLTLIECRLHGRPQDVMWIEELIGRRASLSASAVVAVSSNGFTDGAKKKAAAYNVALRDFRSLGDDEIRSWGEPKRVWIHYLQFLEIDLSFGIAPGFDRSPLRLNQAHFREALIPFINGAMEKASEMEGEKEEKKFVDAGATLTLGGPLFDAVGASEAVVRSPLFACRKQVPLASVAAYDKPDVAPADRSTRVSDFGEGLFEIAQSENRAAIAVDFSTFEIPKNSYIYGALVDLGQNLWTNFKILGFRLPRFERGVVKIRTHPAGTIPPPLDDTAVDISPP